MTMFSKKTLQSVEMLGEKLKRLREGIGVSIEQLASMTGVSPRHLEAIEASEYQKLPGEVYIKGFLRSYAEALHIQPDRVQKLYEKERTSLAKGFVATAPPKEITEARVVNLPKFFKHTAIVLSVAALLVYLGIKVKHSVTPPELTITTPSADLVVHELSLEVAGSTEHESIVRINGQEVVPDAEGDFLERVHLQPGLNIIKVSARRERSKERILYRQVIVEDSPAAVSEDGNNSLSSS